MRQRLAFRAFAGGASVALALFVCAPAFALDDGEQSDELIALQAALIGAGEAEDDYYFGVAARDWFSDDVSAQRKQRPPRPPKKPPAPPPPPPPPPPPGGGTGVTIGILDTGVDYNHQEFTGRYSPYSTCVAGTSACSGVYAGAGGDNNSHGTHVAGIAAGATVGLATTATILSVKVLDSGGSGSYTAIANGIVYAADHGADVINMSLGGTAGSSNLLTALRYAAPSSVIVAAAGNDGNTYRPLYPAAYATANGVIGSMIIAGAVDSSGTIAWFSNTPGPCTSSPCWADYFLVAPGVSIRSSVPGNQYAYYSGTSMATPYISGTAALVLAQSPQLTPQQVVDILLTSAIDRGAPGTDWVYGRGQVNPSAALSALGATSVPTSGASVATFEGTGEVRGAMLAGPFAGALSASALLSGVVLLDRYGRDYRVNLAAGIGEQRMSLADALGIGSAPVTAMSLAMDKVSAYALVSSEETMGIADPMGIVADGQSVEIGQLYVAAQFSESSEVALGHGISLAGKLNDYDADASLAYDGLFLSGQAFNSPYLLMVEGGDFLGFTTAIGDVTLRAGIASANAEEDEANMLAYNPYLADIWPDALYQGQSAETVAMGISWRAADWLGIGATFSETYEDNSALGLYQTGALSIVDEARTRAMGVNLRAGLGGGYVLSLAGSMGVSDIAPAYDGLVTSFTPVTSASYGIAVAKHGVFGEDDALGFAVSRPLHIVGGEANLMAAVDVNGAREIVYGTEVLPLAPAEPETDLELGYATPILDGRASFQLNAAYQLNAGGVEGEDGVAALVRFRIGF